MKLSRFLFVLVVFLLSASVSLTAALAQDQTCLGLVDGALTAAREICSQTNRHEVCYGHILVNAQAQDGFELVNFDSPGDMTSVATLQSLKLSEFDTQSGDWGVAQMRLQASLANEQSGDVTVLIFGDVELQNSVPIPTQVEITIGGQGYLPVYAEPSSAAKVEQVLLTGTTMAAVEQSDDGLWLRVELPEANSGWVEAANVTSTGDLSTLNVGDANAPYYHPMQAFYFQSGENPSSCSTVPANGLLIQTPQGVGKVNLLINEVNIQLGSTAFLQAVPGKQMTISLLEGSSTVEAQGVTTTLLPGSQVSVPLDENLIPNAPPSDPQPYEIGIVENLPVQLLEREIVIVPPSPHTFVQPLTAPATTTQVTETSAIEANSVIDNSTGGETGNSDTNNSGDTGNGDTNNGGDTGNGDFNNGGDTGNGDSNNGGGNGNGDSNNGGGNGNGDSNNGGGNGNGDSNNGGGNGHGDDHGGNGHGNDNGGGNGHGGGGNGHGGGNNG